MDLPVNPVNPRGFYKNFKLYSKLSRAANHAVAFASHELRRCYRAWTAVMHRVASNGQRRSAPAAEPRS